MVNEHYVSRIFFLEQGEHGEESLVFMISPGDGGPTAVRLVQESEERLVARAMGLTGSSRSGDLLVEAKHPYYFAPWGSIYHGQHGRSHLVEDHVPLLILNPSGDGHRTVKSVVEVTDIGPTVAGIMGFLDFLPSDGKDLLDPPRILISSHSQDQAVPAGKVVSILGFAQDSVGIKRVEFRIGDEEKFLAADGDSVWEAKIQLPPGRHAITVRAIDETDLQSTVRFHLVAR
jgi:hypothetical protein